MKKKKTHILFFFLLSFSPFLFLCSVFLFFALFTEIQKWAIQLGVLRVKES